MREPSVERTQLPLDLPYHEGELPVDPADLIATVRRQAERAKRDRQDLRRVLVAVKHLSTELPHEAP